jgi:hypothetical protein
VKLLLGAPPALEGAPALRRQVGESPGDFDCSPSPERAAEDRPVGQLHSVLVLFVKHRHTGGEGDGVANHQDAVWRTGMEREDCGVSKATAPPLDGMHENPMQDVSPGLR